MALSLQERKSKILKRLEFTLENTHTIICDINNKLERIVGDSEVLERTACAYEIWSRKNAS
ncbi:hypothetical protein EHEL_091495 [Encephalitozoon hellem ATCC 50504]|uniref:Uncharacterized protein n=1 Tax=Encephalitozoon hellem TaxID=27973 RepID=A0A9Q9FAB1_ENCHE|nr:uncharacterized protein EHEL_091495 [Encephalitozoon hellem ATCC 50504]AHL28968.1 hypothetical protein EHEL_091495 [Encephalitozoon hellem ATCC 50504]UTX44062.1 hypothetical protein GPU96_09g18430 [Encephalitozoon hellem]WEL39545.1 hypothetical protein PFJ87_09g01740 [Encephalitozoon hellem]